ncbi:MAG: nucleoside-diphosphate kinase [Pseudonocardiaceae bacterium]
MGLDVTTLTRHPYDELVCDLRSEAAGIPAQRQVLSEHDRPVPVERLLSIEERAKEQLARSCSMVPTRWRLARPYGSSLRRGAQPYVDIDSSVLNASMPLPRSHGRSVRSPLRSPPGHSSAERGHAWSLVPASENIVTRIGRNTMTDSTDLGVERTLVLLKPDAVARGLTGRIVARFEDALLKIVGVKMKQLDAGFTRTHYFDLEERLGTEVYNTTAAFMQTGPVIALVLEGVGAVAKVRTIIGSTYPDEAPPGTIRGDFSHQTKASSKVSGKAIINLVHASGNSEEAKYEVGLWFGEDEQFDYETLAEKLAY